MGKAESSLLITVLLFLPLGRVTIFLFEFLKGHFFLKPFMGEGHNFLAKRFLSYVASPPPPLPVDK